MFLRLGGAFLLIFVMAIAGCGSKSTAVQTPARISAGTWAGMMQGASITLSLSEDGRFQTVFNGGKFRAVVRGRAKIDKSTLLLEATEVDGTPANSSANKLPVKFTFSPEWAVLTSESGLTLNRKI